MERLTKYNWARHYVQIGVIFCAETNNNITVKKSPWYCGRDHSGAFCVLNFGRYSYINTRT